jgi:FlaA1/EpsC-like NDP-sugar epimerase
MSNRRHGYTPVGFVDDDKAKEGKKILGLPVYGGIDVLPRLCQERSIVAVLLSTTNIQAERLIVLRRVADEANVPLIQLYFELHVLRTSA